MNIIQELRFFIDCSPSQIQLLKQDGVISWRLYRHYKFLWLWSAWRDNYQHERFYNRMGSDAYWRRIERVKAIVERIRVIPVPSLEHIPFRLGSIND